MSNETKVEAFEEKSTFDANELIAEELRLPSSGHHLYQTGLSWFPNGCPKRSLLHHPVLVFIVTVGMTIRFTYSVMTPNKPEIFYLYIGDYGYFMNMRLHLNMTAALVYNMSVMSQILHFYYYMIDKKPTYMKVFNMMSGAVTPASIGLFDEMVLKKIMKKSKLSFKIMKFLSASMSLMAFFISFFSYIFRITFWQMITLGMIHTLCFFLGSYYIFHIITYQIFYFYIISYYVKSKQKSVNDYLRNCIKNEFKTKIYNSDKLGKTLHKIYLEIAEYDSNTWSKVLAIIWVTSSSVVALVIFMFAFGYSKMPVYVTIILCYASFFFTLLLMILIETAGSVNLEVKKCYKLLASYKLVCMRTKQSTVGMARHGLKFLNIFERIGQKKKNKIGFSCSKLFVINYFRGYEVLALCAIVLIRLIQMEKEKQLKEAREVMGL